MCEVEPSESAWLKRVAKAASAASPIRIGAPGVSWNQGRSPKSGFLVGPPSSPLLLVFCSAAALLPAAGVVRAALGDADPLFDG